MAVPSVEACSTGPKVAVAKVAVAKVAVAKVAVAGARAVMDSFEPA
jgi:hypothetical protein